jgi:DDE superfamily endonuclease
MEDVLSVYERPRDPQRPLVCLDEFCKQLLAPARPAVPAQPGEPAREDYEYVRCGMCSAFMIYSPLEGRREVRVSGQRTAVEYARTIRWLCDEVYPQAEKIVLVQDNLNTHGPASLYEAFPPQEALRLKERIEWHYCFAPPHGAHPCGAAPSSQAASSLGSPKHGSWLNMAEPERSGDSRRQIEIGVAQRQCLDRRIESAQSMTSALQVWSHARNAAGASTDWRFTLKDARCKLKRLYPASSLI